MRTTALIGLAALVAGAFSASAQIYSQNIVGYYNVPTPTPLTAMCVSLKTGNNRADQVIPFNDGDNIQTWNGSSWIFFKMDSGAGTGWADSDGNDVALVNLPVLSLGTGFFYGNQSGKSSLTIVGEVAIGTTTISIPSGLQAVGSMLPYAGPVDSATVNLQVPDGSNLQFWDGVAGQWIFNKRDTGSGTGWVDGDGNDLPAVPQLSIGQGFFLGNQNADSVSWSQTLTP